MNPLEKEVRQMTRLWVQKGGKTNRRQQRQRMVAFASRAAYQGANCMAEVGKRHVVDYWKAREELSKSTLYNYWRALCLLWSLADKPGYPPKPHALAKSAEQEEAEVG
jgi:hypothetical protein